MTENRVSTPTDLADRWRRFCEALLGELRPETGSWWRSGAFWLLSWVMRRRMRREAEAAAAFIQAAMQEVLAALEAVQAGKLAAVAPPEVGADGGGTEARPLERAARASTVPCGGPVESSFRVDDEYEGAHAGLETAGPCRGTLDSGPRSSLGQARRRNDEYGGRGSDGENEGADGVVAGGIALDSSPGSTRGLRGNDGPVRPVRPVRSGLQRGLTPWARPPPFDPANGRARPRTHMHAEIVSISYRNRARSKAFEIGLREGRLGTTAAAHRREFRAGLAHRHDQRHLALRIGRRRRRGSMPGRQPGLMLQHAHAMLTRFCRTLLRQTASPTLVGHTHSRMIGARNRAFSSP